MAISEDFINKLNLLAEEGRITSIADYLGFRGEYGLIIDLALIRGIEVCKNKSLFGRINALLKRGFLSEAMVLECINILLEAGRPLSVPSILKKKGLSDAVILRCVEIWAKQHDSDSILPSNIDSIISLLDRKRLNPEVKNAVELRLLKVVQDFGECGKIHSIVSFLKRGNLSPTLKQAAEEALVRAVEFCGKTGKLGNLVQLLSMDGLDQAMMHPIEQALLVGISVCKENHWLLSDIYQVLRVRGLFDTVMVRGIDALADDGQIRLIVGLLDRNELNNGVRKAAEPALIRAAEVCGETGQLYDNLAFSLIDRENLSTNTKIKCIEVCRKYGKVDLLVKLLDEGRLAPSLRDSIRYALPAAVEVCRVNGETDSVVQLLERVDLKNKLMLRCIEICGDAGYIIPIIDSVAKIPGATTTLIRPVERALLKGVEVCYRKGDIDSVILLLSRYNIVGPVALRCIEICGDVGATAPLADLFLSRVLSRKEKLAAEEALVRAVEVCSRNQWFNDLSSLFDRTDLDPVLRSRCIRALEKSADSEVTRYLRLINPLAGEGVTSIGTVKAPTGRITGEARRGKIAR